MQSHVLIVDDEAPIREMLRVALERQHYRVTDVSSTAEAFRVARENPPDLVISDLQLEESDGLEMITGLKDLRPNMPVLLLTGVVFDARAIESALGSKISSYLHKTASLSAIVAEVKRLIGEPKA